MSDISFKKIKFDTRKHIIIVELRSQIPSFIEKNSELRHTRY